MPGVNAIGGVDEVLRKLAKDTLDTATAAGTITTSPAVTVGPLDRQSDDPRLNWYLYSVGPNAAYRNMEPLATAWPAARGHPPLALHLNYLLTAFPGKLTSAGDEDEFIHSCMTLVMQQLQSKAILDDPTTQTLAGPLVEPLRITLQSLDLDSLSKIWTGSQLAMRLSAGYEVSLVIIDSTQTFAPGPPVRERRVVAIPSMGPSFTSLSPARVSFGDDISVGVAGLSAGSTFILRRVAADPAPPPPVDWPMVVKSRTNDSVVLNLPRPDLAPGLRELRVATVQSGIEAGADSAALTVVPNIKADDGPKAATQTVTLTTVNASNDVQVFLNGVSVPQVTFVSPVQVQFVVPGGAAKAPAQLQLRAGRVAGQLYFGFVVQ